MTWQTAAYFSSILLTFLLTGFLARYAWRQPALPGVRAYAAMALCECLLALAEILSMLGSTPAQALFWFNLRFPFIAIVPVLWLVFALEYYVRRDWFSKRLLAGLCIIPFITQIMLLTNSRHGLWLKQDVSFHQDGPFWIAEISARIPGLWFMVHSFYSLILLLAGIGVIFFAAWHKGHTTRSQALLLSGGALVALGTTLVSLFNLIPQAGFNPFIPGIGISALLYALAVFRFQFLKRTHAREGNTRLTRLGPQEERSLAGLILVFILFTSGIAAVGYLTYQNYERQFRSQVERQLSSTAALKVNGLENWRAERMADAESLYHTPAFAALVQSSLENPSDVRADAQLQAWLDTLRNSGHYERVYLLDTAGSERAASPATPEPTAAHLTPEAAAITHSSQVTFLDFHRDSPDGKIHLAVLVPIHAEQDPGRTLGLLVLRIDPEIYLYPYINQWPGSSTTAETLLVRRDGKDVLFLNDLRFMQDTALNLRIPLEDTSILAVKAVLGQTGLVEGLDYNGQPAIGYVSAVADSPWYLVGRMTVDEAYLPLRERRWETILFFGLLIAAAGTGLVLVWRQQQMRNNQAQVRAMETLRLSEEKFRLAFSTSPDSIAITRMRDGMFVSVNKGFEQISGYTQEQAIGKTSLEINIWKEPEDRRKVVEGLQAKGEVQNYEAPFLTRNGEIYGLMSAVIIMLNGEPHILNITRDITERKQAEEKLIASEARYRRLFEAARDGILILDAETGVVLDANPFLVKMLGLSPEEILGKELWELGCFKDIAANKANFLELQQKGYIRYEDLPLETADGQRKNVEFVSNVYQVNHHKVIQCNIRDITERKQAEDELAERNATLKAILESANAPIFSLDRGYRYTSFNSAHAAVMKALYGAEIEIGKNMLEYQSRADDQSEALKNLDRALNGERFIESGFSGEPGRTRRYFEVAHSPICEPGGEIIGVSVFVNDITERRQAEEALQEYNTRLETDIAVRTRELREAQEKLVRQERLAALGQLAGSIGHELRNPLGVIMNAVYFLKMSQPDADEIVREYLDIIENETRASDKIITDLLDFTRIKSVEPKPASVPELLRQVLMRYPAPASVQAVFELPPDLPPVHADPQHVVQILGNLVINAYQAMPDGGKLTLSASAEGDMIVIGVQDTGVGILSENMGNLFEPLFTTKIKGIGLGLAISRKLAGANEGRIEVQSESGKGSMFRLYLPVSVP